MFLSIRSHLYRCINGNCLSLCSGLVPTGMEFKKSELLSNRNVFIGDELDDFIVVGDNLSAACVDVDGFITFDCWKELGFDQDSILVNPDDTDSDEQFFDKDNIHQDLIIQGKCCARFLIDPSSSNSLRVLQYLPSGYAPDGFSAGPEIIDGLSVVNYCGLCDLKTGLLDLLAVPTFSGGTPSLPQFTLCQVGDDVFS